MLSYSENRNQHREAGNVEGKESVGPCFFVSQEAFFGGFLVAFSPLPHAAFAVP